MPMFGAYVSDRTLSGASDAFFRSPDLQTSYKALLKYPRVFSSSRMTEYMRMLIKAMHKNELVFATREYEQALELFESISTKGLEVAWQEYKLLHNNEPSRDDAITAIGTLMDKKSDEAKRLFMEQQPQVFLSNTIQLVLYELAASSRQRKPLFSLRLEYTLRLIEYARKHNINDAWIMSQNVYSALDTFMTASDWESSRKVVEEKSDLLLSRFAITCLEGVVVHLKTSNSKLDQMLAQVRLTYLNLLKESRESSIASAWNMLKMGKLSGGLTDQQLAKIKRELKSKGILS